MTKTLIWLHDEALRVNHPVFAAAPQGAKAIYIWDETYLKQMGYSLKRLVFIYETLSELNIDIIAGETCRIIDQFAPESLYFAKSYNPALNRIIADIPGRINLHAIAEEQFVDLPDYGEFKRFFKYWNKARKNAFAINGQRAEN